MLVCDTLPSTNNNAPSLMEDPKKGLLHHATDSSFYTEATASTTESSFLEDDERDDCLTSSLRSTETSMSALSLDSCLAREEEEEDAETDSSSILPASPVSLEESSSMVEPLATLPTRKVSFASVSIRTHALTLGDHPECSEGPPLSLDWEYNQDEFDSLEAYESAKAAAAAARKEPRTLSCNFPVRTCLQRRRLLHLEYGIPISTLKASERQVVVDRQKRASSVQDGGKLKARVQSALWAVQRKVRKVVTTK